ncbi:hypothetical protein SAMN05421839_11524 [Halolactibacillus halophilus]|uniref:Uncharacterized protein n=1 Tax=Halolactibacillus halophilus TaxID=306540 RepID=A0A1I5PJM4_9BACI|nr:hypothetical protein [Halolactibacillus halophilus]GEM02046.1 hypothetical protein HHA03_15780 [Halolactibacillus halophilus]SFP34245.1 hypothetical protein SAMN05421839_11524 [Halolactibacillus halophilus]
MTVENEMSDPTLPTKIIPFIHDGDFFFTKGVDAFYKRKFDLALKEEIDVFEDEDDLLMYQETAFYYLQHEDYLKAVTILEEALELFPEYDLFHFQSRFARFFNGEQKAMLKEEETALIIEPDQLYARFNLMFFYRALGEEEKLNEIVASFKGVYPMHQEQALKVAIGYTLAGHEDEAVIRFNRLQHRTVKHHVDYYKYYALALYRHGKVTEAEALFEEAKRRHTQLINKKAPWLEQHMSKSVDEGK